MKVTQGDGFCHSLRQAAYRLSQIETAEAVTNCFGKEKEGRVSLGNFRGLVLQSAEGVL